MLGWFSAKCPLATRDKTWTERRMLWLADRFGIRREHPAAALAVCRVGRAL